MISRDHQAEIDEPKLHALCLVEAESYGRATAVPEVEQGRHLRRREAGALHRSTPEAALKADGELLGSSRLMAGIGEALITGNKRQCGRGVK